MSSEISLLFRAPSENKFAAYRYEVIAAEARSAPSHCLEGEGEVTPRSSTRVSLWATNISQAFRLKHLCWGKHTARTLSFSLPLIETVDNCQNPDPARVCGPGPQTQAARALCADTRVAHQMARRVRIGRRQWNKFSLCANVFFIIKSRQPSTLIPLPGQGEGIIPDPLFGLLSKLHFWTIGRFSTLSAYGRTSGSRRSLCRVLLP